MTVEKIICGKEEHDQIKAHLDEIKKIWLKLCKENNFFADFGDGKEGETPHLSLTVYGDGTLNLCSLLKTAQDEEGNYTEAVYAIKGWYYPEDEKNADEE